MKTVSQYKEDIKALMDKANAMDAQCVNENRDPASAELTIQKEILDTVQEYQDIVATLERKERMQDALKKPEPALTQPGPVKASGIVVGIDRASKDRFKSFGEQLAAVLRAARPGASVDSRLFNAATGMGETVPADGGFLVQQDFSNELLTQVFQTGILAPKCRRIQISGNANSMKINGVDETSRVATRSGGILGYWVDEAADKTASKPKFRQIELNLHKLIGLVYSTDELLADAVALEAFIRQAFVAEFGFLLDEAIINGTGAGQPMGVLNSGSLVTVAKETGQKAQTVMAENIMKMRSRLFASSRQNAIWLINQNIEPSLHSMSLSVGTGGIPVYMPAGGLSNLPYDTLYGRPVFPIEQCQTLGTVGDIILADFNSGYIIAEKGGIRADMSIHVAFVSDQSLFRFVMRVDGQPVRASALTPAKGGADYTQSHFVTLATRA